MTVIRPNSISGVTSITAHTQSIEFYKSDGSLSGANLDGVNINTAGILTAANFKNASSDVHSTGIDVGSNIKIGSGGIITATSYRGDGSQLTGISGLSLANGADNRVVTATGAAALTGESTLTFDGTKLETPRLDCKGLMHLEYSSSTNTNYMMTMNNNNGIMHIFRGDALYIGNNMNTSNQGSGPNNKAIELKTNGDVRITGNFNCLSDNRGIYFGGSNQLRILGLDNGDSIIDAVSGSCKIQDNGSGCITFGGGTVDVKQKLKVDYTVSGSDYVAFFRNGNANAYGVVIQEPSSVNTGYPSLAITNSSGQSHFRVDTNGLVYANSGAGTDKKAYFVRAWISFDAAGTNQTRGSGNATWSDYGTGDFGINFTTAMPDTGYAMVGNAGYNSGQVMIGLTGGGLNSAPTTSGFRFSVRANYSNSTLMDEEYVHIIVAR